MEEDASERLWPLYGTLAHMILEQFAGEGDHMETEAIAEVDGLRISGHIDLLVLPDGIVAGLQVHQCLDGGRSKTGGEGGVGEPAQRLSISVGECG